MEVINILKREKLFYLLGILIILVSVIIGLDLRNPHDQRLALIYILGVLFLMVVAYGLRKMGFTNTDKGFWWPITSILYLYSRVDMVCILYLFFITKKSPFIFPELIFNHI